MKHQGTQTLQTERLVLRRFTVEDAPVVFRNWTGDDEVTRYLSWPTHTSEGITRMVLEDWVRSYEKPDFYTWAIEFEGEPVGSISVVELRENVQAAEIGYCIGKRWWHQGITSEALKAVMDFLFEQVGFNRISARHDSRNPNSGGVMKKCGMTLEGIHRQSDCNNQGICDTCVYAILASER
ncbi:MAG: GNAT family N-acetyltransferase [Ruminococcaceae bacterium]|nr:GNAT family N-acetyltransferase [Oscillospiraceae bacterium]MBQ3214525.1 GNAT family N-acetyltransferase [Oscillospiraceae bacterium]